MEEREVSLSVKQVQRYEVIRASLVGRMTVLEAAPALGVSPRQVKRLRRKVEAAGAEGVIHGNAGREPHNRTPDDLRERVIGMARHEYARYNFSHLADTLSEEHGVKLSAETLPALASSPGAWPALAPGEDASKKAAPSAPGRGTPLP